MPEKAVAELLLADSPEDGEILTKLSATDYEARKGNPAKLKDGKFLLRDSTNVAHDHILSMMRGGKPVHLPVVKTRGVFKLDGISCGAAATLADLIRWASDPHPAWKTVLMVGVPGLRCVSDEELIELQLKQELQRQRASASRLASSQGDSLFKKAIERRQLQEREAADLAAREKDMRDSRARAQEEQRQSKANRTGELRQGMLANLPDVTAFAARSSAHAEASDSDSDGEVPQDLYEGETREEDESQDPGYLEIQTVDLASQWKHEASTYMHGEATLAEADGLLYEAADGDNSGNGRFLLRDQRDPGNYILSVIQDGNPVHHALVKEANGTYSVSGQSTGQQELDGLLALLSQSDIDWWPVPLTSPIEPELDRKKLRSAVKKHKGRSVRHAKDVQRQASSSSLAKTSPVKAPKVVVKKHSKQQLTTLMKKATAIADLWENRMHGYDSADDGDGEEKQQGRNDKLAKMGPHYHGNITTEQAASLVGTDKGRFLYWSKQADNQNELVVTVTFRGMATHHVLTRTKAGAAFQLNGVDIGCTTLEQTTAHLAQKHPYWCVASLGC